MKTPDPETYAQVGTELAPTELDTVTVYVTGGVGVTMPEEPPEQNAIQPQPFHETGFVVPPTVTPPIT